MFTVDKTSWHYKMADRWLKFSIQWDMPDDFCRYWRFVVLGTILFSITVLLAVSFVVFNIGGIILVFTGNWSETGVFAAFNFLTGIVGLVLGFSVAIKFLSDKFYSRQKMQQLKETGFVGTWYKSFKDKVCIQVEYK